jgi:hypothetical protein
MFGGYSGNAVREKEAWGRWAIGLALVSVYSGTCGWFLYGDFPSRAYMVLLPWVVAVACLAVSLIWGVSLVPFMMLVARLAGRSAPKQKKTDSFDPDAK